VGRGQLFNAKTPKPLVTKKSAFTYTKKKTPMGGGGQRQAGALVFYVVKVLGKRELKLTGLKLLCSENARKEKRPRESSGSLSSKKQSFSKNRVGKGTKKTPLPAPESAGKEINTK